MIFIKVLKFGGSSLADCRCIKAAMQIIFRQSESIIVVSAPGKRFADDTKITDLFLSLYLYKQSNQDYNGVLEIIQNRFLDLSKLIDDFDFNIHIKKIEQDIKSDAGLDYIISRGEYLCAIFISKLLGYEFIDASRIIKFDDLGRLDKEKTFLSINKILKNKKKAIVPGFYGAMPNGSIKTFSRGGSDITGAVIAAALGADEYQNWTDIDGFYFCPLLDYCKPIKNLSYDDAKILSYMGSNVLHHDCLPICKKGLIPIRIKDTFNPHLEGTLINDFCTTKAAHVVGFSGKSGFYSIRLKALNNNINGTIKRLCDEEEFMILSCGNQHCTLITDKFSILNELNLDNLKINKVALIAIVGDIKTINNALSICNLKPFYIDNKNSCVFVCTEEKQLKNTMHLLCIAFKKQ